jgi:hypothetical protein
MHHNIYFYKNGLCLFIYGWLSTLLWFTWIPRVFWIRSDYIWKLLNTTVGTFFSQKALYELHLVFSFGPQSCKNLWKQKKTLLEPLFSTRYQFMKQYWELWSFDPWFTVLDVNVLSSMPESKWKAQPQENLCDPSNWFMTSNFGKIGESPELA